MEKRIRKNLKCMMISLLLLSVSNSLHSKDLSSRNYLNISKDGIDVVCILSDKSDYYNCHLKYFERQEKLLISAYFCPNLEIFIETKNILKLGCSSSHYVSNYHYYKYNNNGWFLFKYEFVRGPTGPSDIGDEFTVDNDFLRSLNINLFSAFISEPISFAIVNSKAYLYDKNKNKKKNYLVKGDRVLVLSRKIHKDKSFFRVFYQGKKNIDTWIEENFVDIQD